jgi:hypothetical protein
MTAEKSASGRTTNFPESIQVRPRTTFISFSAVAPCARRWCHQMASQRTLAAAAANAATRRALVTP